MNSTIPVGIPIEPCSAVVKLVVNESEGGDGGEPSGEDTVDSRLHGSNDTALVAIGLFAAAMVIVLVIGMRRKPSS
jgi:hypothetical protein